MFFISAIWLLFRTLAIKISGLTLTICSKKTLSKHSWPNLQLRICRLEDKYLVLSLKLPKLRFLVKNGSTWSQTCLQMHPMSLLISDMHLLRLLASSVKKLCQTTSFKSRKDKWLLLSSIISSKEISISKLHSLQSKVY